MKKSTSFIITLQILNMMFGYRRIQPHNCQGNGCEDCLEPFREKVMARIEDRLPIRFIMLAFPFKSPNQTKVISNLPDMAELISLRRLYQTVADFKKLYEPGIEFIIGGDGRIFADLIPGIDDEGVTTYVTALKSMIANDGLADVISFRGLDDIFPTITNFDELRRQLPALQSRETLNARAKNEPDFLNQVNGISRFLNEDITAMEVPFGKNEIRRMSRDTAFDLIARGDSLRQLLTKCYPDAVRLSIHPQAHHTDKIGIGIMPGVEDNWITPWHGVAVEVSPNNFILMKKMKAVEMGAQLVQRPFPHYTMPDVAASSSSSYL